MGKRFTLSVLAAAATALALTSTAGAIRHPTDQQLNGIRAAVLPARNPYLSRFSAAAPPDRGRIGEFTWLRRPYRALVTRPP